MPRQYTTDHISPCENALYKFTLYLLTYLLTYLLLLFSRLSQQHSTSNFDEFQKSFYSWIFANFKMASQEFSIYHHFSTFGCLIDQEQRQFFIHLIWDFCGFRVKL